jgi:hypothetical protein
MSKMKAFVATAVITLSGCDDTPLRNVDAAEANNGEVFTTTGRVSVTRIDQVSDRLAYGGIRGIYVIRDNETGTEYIGVSGIGITEVGSHPVGKTRRTDER